MSARDVEARLPAAAKIVVRYLAEAGETEGMLVRTLQEHLSSTPKGDYRRVLERHLRVTEKHRDAVEGRLRELGADPTPVRVGLGVLGSIVERALAIITAPLGVLRGQPGTEEVLLTIARGESAARGWEIATYRTLEVLAEHAGDATTARMASRIRADEEQMLAELHELIPALTDALAIPNVSGPSTADEPWPGYDKQTVAEINRLLSKADDDLAKLVRDYEDRHKKRSTILRRAGTRGNPSSVMHRSD